MTYDLIVPSHGERVLTGFILAVQQRHRAKTYTVEAHMTGLKYMIDGLPVDAPQQSTPVMKRFVALAGFLMKTLP